MTPDTCREPADPLVASLVGGFDDETRQAFTVRTAVIQQAGQYTRGHAECLALLSLLQARPDLLTGLSMLAVELDGATQWVLTGHAAFARQQLFDAGAIELEEVDPADVVRSQYGDLAMLSTFG